MNGCPPEPSTAPTAGNLCFRLYVYGNDRILARWSFERAPEIFAPWGVYALSEESMNQDSR